MKLATHLLRRYTTNSAGAVPPLITTTHFPAPHTGTITLLTLNRPSQKNALSLSLLHALSTSITTLPPTTRSLIIASGVPGIFCAGADLKERKHFTQEQTNAFLATLRGTLHALSSLPFPTISAISSHALGGGVELALATDLRIAGPHATFSLPETRLAIVPGVGGIWRLRELIGASRAADMVLTGRRVSAGEACNMGLVNRVVALQEGDGEGRGEVIVGALELAEEIGRGGPVAVREGLVAVRKGGEEAERVAYEGVVRTEDRGEALRGFAEKRPVVFKGR